jgi:alpha-glucosidase
MVSDAPSAYAHQPAFQFIKDVPAAWDETRVLDGFPGNDITIARRRGRDWYLGSITDWDARDERIPLSFLGGGKYTAEIYEDASDAAENPEHVTIRHQTVSASGTLTVHLAPGGGCAIHFVRR